MPDAVHARQQPPHSRSSRHPAITSSSLGVRVDHGRNHCPMTHMAPFFPTRISREASSKRHRSHQPRHTSRSTSRTPHGRSWPAWSHLRSKSQPCECPPVNGTEGEERVNPVQSRARSASSVALGDSSRACSRNEHRACGRERAKSWKGF